MHPLLHTKDNQGGFLKHFLTPFIFTDAVFQRPETTVCLCSSGCEEVMTALDECHARGFLWKTVGGCTKAKHAVNMCLRKERLKRTQENRDKAKVKNAKIREIWADIDANS
ncbi:UPF0287-domain-containing protein [Eremomyces bilateralis CBS 781.70]|uniref:COX assembly mitochondrial protein n=1 Tax=Eremomyces bilateralis CBS 781.70 TaxID=1392243 RepID=A0A6G1G375_9PEZI|nr:UPF0287-domain-containing protein [Eremomyces bilateralis CBS 781.70]KAF1812381.1 UPF0287-domain-containing protein [Eremomyces bilateralis CBS 781.70]